MHRQLICPPLLARVLDFFKKQQVKPYDRQQVLANLPFELRSKILRHLYAGFIARVPLLQTMAHDDMFLTDVCVRLQYYTCTRESFVYQRGAWAALLAHCCKMQASKSSVSMHSPPICFRLLTLHNYARVTQPACMYAHAPLVHSMPLETSTHVHMLRRRAWR